MMSPTKTSTVALQKNYISFLVGHELKVLDSSATTKYTIHYYLVLLLSVLVLNNQCGPNPHRALRVPSGDFLIRIIFLRFFLYPLILSFLFPISHSVLFLLHCLICFAFPIVYVCVRGCLCVDVLHRIPCLPILEDATRQKRGVGILKSLTTISALSPLEVGVVERSI